MEREETIISDLPENSDPQNTDVVMTESPTSTNKLSIGNLFNFFKRLLPSGIFVDLNSDSSSPDTEDLKIKNVLPVAHGGTGANTVAGARNALGLGDTDGALPIANGGTGATNVSRALSNLGLGTWADVRSAAALGHEDGPLSALYGGTGGSGKRSGRKGLFIPSIGYRDITMTISSSSTHEVWGSYHMLVGEIPRLGNVRMEAIAAFIPSSFIFPPFQYLYFTFSKQSDDSLYIIAHSAELTAQAVNMTATVKLIFIGDVASIADINDDH